MDKKLSLAEAYKDYFDIGVALNPQTLKIGEEWIKKEFNCITCENEMKPVSVQPALGEYLFKDADIITDYAALNKLKVRGHTLLWHNQTGEWMFKDDNNKDLVCKNILYSRMKDHIDKVLKHYSGKVFCWDVVNEAISDESNEFLRTKSPYYEIVGNEEFIINAFKYAYESDPEVLLFYNDYNTETPEKRDKIIRLIKSLKDKDVPIHGIGLQGHYNIFLDLNELKKSIELFSSLDLLIHITELDVSIYKHEEQEIRFDTPAEAGSRIDKQIELYDKMFTLLREYKSEVKNVTFWGLNDKVSWLNYFPVQNRRNFPLLFDDESKPKDAYNRIINF